MTGASKIPCLYKGLSALKNLKTHTMLQKPSAPTQIHRLSAPTSVKNHSFCRSLLHLTCILTKPRLGLVYECHAYHRVVHRNHHLNQPLAEPRLIYGAISTPSRRATRVYHCFSRGSKMSANFRDSSYRRLISVGSTCQKSPGYLDLCQPLADRLTIWVFHTRPFRICPRNRQYGSRPFAIAGTPLASLR